jgi:hypothetical protein
VTHGGARLAALALTLVGCGGAARAPGAPPGSGQAETAPVAGERQGDLPLDDEAPERTAPATGGPEVTLKLVAEAAKKAHVFWGRKDLGVAPLEIHRPRGSGPLDLLVVAPGYLPLHTRAFTERDETLALRLYDAEGARGLLGYPVKIEGP